MERKLDFQWHLHFNFTEAEHWLQPTCADRQRPRKRPPYYSLSRYWRLPKVLEEKKDPKQPTHSLSSPHLSLSAQNRGLKSLAPFACEIIQRTRWTTVLKTSLKSLCAANAVKIRAKLWVIQDVAQMAVLRIIIGWIVRTSKKSACSLDRWKAETSTFSRQSGSCFEFECRIYLDIYISYI